MTPSPRRVLLIKPSSLGDVITATPVLGGLKRSFPEAKVAWLVTPGCADILKGRPDLDEIILFDRRRYGRMATSPSALAAFVRFCRDLRARRFDWTIDLQGLFRSGFLTRVSGSALRAGFADAREGAWLFYNRRFRPAAVHTIDRNLELARDLGIDARPEDLSLSVTPEGRRFVQSLLAERRLEPGRYLVVAPGTRWPTKVYPARLWRQALDLLNGDVPVVLIGAGDERQFCTEIAGEQELNLAGQTSLEQLVGVVASAGAVVGGDSAANFIAPAVGTPFVALIGPTCPKRTGPYGPLGRAVVADVAGQGCLLRRCRHITCMQSIDPATVADAVRQALRAGGDKPVAGHGE